MRKRMYFVGIMAQIGAFATSAFLLWCMTEIDALKLLCISAMISIVISLPILMQIERWVYGIDG